MLIINNKTVYEKSIILRLTCETAYNKKSQHDAISISDYQKIQNIIDNGNMVTDSTNSWRATHTINNAN